MRKKKLACCSRRQALGIMGVAGLAYSFRDPLTMALDSVLDDVILRTAHASAPPMNLISIIWPGGMSQWSFGATFQRLPSHTYINNPSCVNALKVDHYQNGNNSNTRYWVEEVDVNGKKQQVPAVWKRARIPTTDGKWVPMASILPYMLSIGYRTKDLGHSTGPARALKDKGVETSVDGNLADTSNAPIPAVGLSKHSYSKNMRDPKYGGYRSAKGTPVYVMKGLPSNPLVTILDSFIHDPAKINTTRLSTLRGLMDAALAEYKAYAKSTRPGSEALYRNAEAALSLFRRKWGDLQKMYADLVVKFRDVEKRAVQTPVPYILPKTGTTPKNDYSLTNTSGIGLSEQAAIAVALFKLGLTKTVTLSGPNSSVGAGFSFNTDEHQVTNREATVLVNNARSIALAAIVKGMMDELGPLWAETAICVTSEYCRSPNNEKNEKTNLYEPAGSDHGSDAGRNCLFYKHHPNGPTYLGNLAVNGRGGNSYYGTWGRVTNAASNWGTTLVDHGIALATMCKVLRIQPTNRARSLVDANGRLLIEEQKNA